MINLNYDALINKGSIQIDNNTRAHVSYRRVAIFYKDIQVIIVTPHMFMVDPADLKDIALVDLINQALVDNRLGDTWRVEKDMTAYHEHIGLDNSMVATPYRLGGYPLYIDRALKYPR